MPLFRVLLLFIAGGLARATTVEPPTFPELVEEADAIYRGRVTAVQARRVEGPGGSTLIKTFVTFQVDRTLKGPDQKETVLEFLGGTVGEDTLEVGGMPHFNVGERSILFVQQNGAQFCPLVRIMHGRYHVARDQGTGQDYVARENHVPLTDVAEVVQPLSDERVPAALPTRAVLSRAMRPEDFESRIAGEVRRPTPRRANQR
ncbi:MAG: hypothetical protein RIQ93_1368 [Verrucomicrobiota bacterium]|jgi:hypothetical protein